jgi:predicted nucleotidyltransferase
MMVDEGMKGAVVRWQRVARHLGKVDGVVAIYLFGSQARGQADHLSDVDLAVLLREDLSKDEMWRLEDRLGVVATDLLEAEKVDLFALNLAPLRVQFEIISTGRLLLSVDEMRRTDSEVAIMTRWWDFAEFDARFDRYLLARIKEGFSDAEREQYHATLGTSG